MADPDVVGRDPLVAKGIRDFSKTGKDALKNNPLMADSLNAFNNTSEKPKVEAKRAPGTPPPLPNTPTTPKPPEAGPRRPEVTPEADPRVILNSHNRSFFGRMSEGAKNLARKAYEGLYKIPLVNRIVGKMEIAYHQFWADEHEQKAKSFKLKLDTIDQEIAAMNAAKDETVALYEKLEAGKVLGSTEDKESMIRKADAEISKLSTKRQEQNDEFIKYNSRTIRSISERDRVADKLIDRYQSKLKPIEAELAGFKDLQAEYSLEAKKLEADNAIQEQTFVELEQTKIRLKEKLTALGYSDREVAKKLMNTEETVTRGRNEIQKSKDNMANKQREVEQAIAATLEKVNPYRQKRDEFLRIKENRPIKMNPAPSRQPKGYSGLDMITDNYVSSDGERVETSSTSTSESESEVEPEAVEVETQESAETKEKQPTIKVGTLIEMWNNFLKTIGNDRWTNGEEKIKDKLIVLKDFLNKRKLSKDQELDWENVRTNLRGYYYKDKKLPVDSLSSFNRNLEKFITDNKNPNIIKNDKR